MKKALRDGFITCAFAYLLFSLLVVVLFLTFFDMLSDSSITTRDMLDFLTLGLSAFSWWGNFYYLAQLVPWVASSLILAVLFYCFGNGLGRRFPFSGLSISLYYLVMWLTFMSEGYIIGWGDLAYNLIWLWPIVGFLVGIAASAIVEKVFSPRAE